MITVTNINLANQHQSFACRKIILPFCFCKKFNFTLAVCHGDQSCGDRGVCEYPGICRCNQGYIGNTTGCNQGNY